MFFLVPEPPDGVFIYSVKENSFRVEWIDKNTSYTHLRIVVDPGSAGINFSARCANPNESSCIFERNVTAINVTGLVSGTNYSVRLYRVVNGTSSDRAAENHTYTCKSILLVYLDISLTDYETFVFYIIYMESLIISQNNSAYIRTHEKSPC